MIGKLTKRIWEVSCCASTNGDDEEEYGEGGEEGGGGLSNRCVVNDLVTGVRGLGAPKSPKCSASKSPMCTLAADFIQRDALLHISRQTLSSSLG